MKFTTLLVFGTILIASSLAHAGGNSAIGAALALCGGQDAEETAEQMASLSTLLPDDLIRIDDCQDLCEKKWLSACKGAVGGMSTCWARAMKAFVAISNAECDTNDATAKTCKAAAKVVADEGKVRLKADVAAGRAYCESQGLGICILECAF
jgi:hypothetical protein